MKDYATETDVIETADPLFYPGDNVEYSSYCNGHTLTVGSASWDTLKGSWTYELLYFIGRREYGSVAVLEAFEKELKLVSRQRKN